MRPIHVKKISNFVQSAIVVTTAILLTIIVKPPQFIWRLGTSRWNLWVPDLQISCFDLTAPVSTIW